MTSIAFFSAHRRFPWIRQLPVDGGGVIAGGTSIDETLPDCRLLVVYDEPPEGLMTDIPRENRLVVLSEPPGIKRYLPGYLDQFGLVLGPIEPKGHAGRWIASHPALPWFYGIGFGTEGLVVNLPRDALRNLPQPAKETAISVVLSRKSQLPKHRARLAFVEQLQGALGDRVRVFGRGFQEVGDKAEAIAPFAYHLVLENNDIPHFWTEKTADAYLGWSFPVFSGCANLGDYFPENAFERIDITRPAEAIAQIAGLLDGGARYAESLPALAAARASLFEAHDMLHVFERTLRGQKAPTRLATPVRIRPNTDFSLYHRVRKSLRRLRD